MRAAAVIFSGGNFVTANSKACFAFVTAQDNGTKKGFEFTIV
jgi:hypothetical protein